MTCRYRGGSKSLSTTPVRDLINGPTFVRQLLSPDPKTSTSNSRKRRNESGSKRRTGEKRCECVLINTHILNIAGESSSQSQTPVQRSPMASPTQRAALENEQRALLQSEYSVAGSSLVQSVLAESLLMLTQNEQARADGIQMPIR